MPATTNAAIAAGLERLADRLADHEANEHRVRAYRIAADSVRRTPVSLADLVRQHGPEALKELSGIGDSLASRITGFVHTGRFRLMEELPGPVPPVILFARVPGIGNELARRIHDTLGIESLEALEVAAHDGSLEHVEGFGPRRVRALRDLLHTMLSRAARRRVRHRSSHGSPEPPVGLLLEIDREYRTRAARGELRRIAPRRFNPSGTAWLPILRTHRAGWDVTALFSNTARAHKLDKTDDWVVLYLSRVDASTQYTVVTETRGDQRGRRVVRGREAACRALLPEPVRTS